MALELVGGAAVGAVFGELLSAVMEMKEKAAMFRGSMKQLEATLESLAPLVKEINQYNNELNRSQSEIESLIRVLEEGKQLVSECSKLTRLNYVRKMRYQEKLVALDKSLVRFLNVDLQAQMARDQKQTLHAVNNIVMTLRSHGGCVVCDSVQDQPLQGVELSEIFEEKAHETVKGLAVPPNLVDMSNRRKRWVDMDIVNQKSEADEAQEQEDKKAEEGNQSKERGRTTLRPSSTERQRRTVARGILGFNSTTRSRNPQQNQRSIIMHCSCMSENEHAAVRFRFPNIFCNCGRKAELMILDCGWSKDRLYYCCEGGSCSVFEWLVPAADDASGSSTHEKESEKMITQYGPLIMQRLHTIEDTAGQLKLLTPAILLFCCFNLVLTSVILMCK